MRRTLVAVLGATLASMACGERGQRTPEGESLVDSLRYGGTVVVASLTEAHSMNPLASTDDISQDLQVFVLFTPLIKYNESLEPAPHLAESWDTVSSGDGLVLTFRLRDDVEWHDGKPTTAYDVAFTFERIKDPSTAYPRVSRFALYDSAVVQDSFTVSFYLERHAGYMDPWRTTPPIPEHILGDVPPTALREHSFGSNNPTGNGPFRFVEHRLGDRWVFEANTRYPEELGGRPYVDRLVYRYVEEPTTRLAEFLTGEVDVYLIVAPSQIEEIEEYPEARLLRYANRNYAFINWNERRPFFQDAKVRRALTLAIDRQEIVDVVQQGLGQVATGPVPPFHWAYDADLKPLPYDPDSARVLLDAAGWIDQDGDGVRERGGVPASFELTTNAGNPAREDILTLVQAQLRQIGVEVRTRTQEAQSLRADVTSPERRFDAFVLGWSTDFNLDDRRLFACSQLGGAFQWAGYCNPRVDEILEQVVLLEDRTAAMSLWGEYQRIMQHDQPYTFLYYDVRANAVRTRVKNVEMDIRGDFINAQDWWIEPASRR